MSRTRTARKPYGLFRFTFDLLFGFLTCGLWWVYLVLRAIRGRN